MIPPTVVGNWKMNGTASETEALLMEIASRWRDLQAAEGRAVDLVVSPPFTSLPLAARLLAGTGIGLGAQNCHWEEEGPFTGEVSAKMLAEIGCSHVIVGHSERREFFGETDHRVSQKARQALFWGMTPIICVGEKRDERDSGRADIVIEAQIERCLEGVTLDPGRRLIVAYEPIWAIGTGHVPAPEEIRSAQRVIRQELTAAYGERRAAALPILYGGSISKDNVGRMLDREVVDGVLVGGASLSAEDFMQVVRRARKAGPRG
jgi:triosephosphate isomerase